MKNALIVFVKNPALGKVKTRLAKTVGDEKALTVYQKLLEHTQKISEGTDADKFVFYSDFIDHKNEWKNSQKKLQSAGDLGSKMQNAFADIVKENYEKVIIIGSDCYELTTAIIEDAFTQLNSYDVVIGPAADGGYYLLGMKQLYTQLFQNKEWSTPQVLQQTMADINQLQLNYFLLPQLNDIDEEKDLAGTDLL